jgi:hypothetical protein
MFRQLAALTILVVLAGGFGLSLFATTDEIKRPGDLVVHEWGTFTTVAGPHGQAIDWLPLSGPTDLPCFVEHFGTRGSVKVLSTSANQIPATYAQARTGLRASVRMETPVLYFYSSRPETVDVRVDFPQGLITEWYPSAKVLPRDVRLNALGGSPNTLASITWANTRVLPKAEVSFPKGSLDSHYYAARETDADPIQVGSQYEKFLFYRGVGSFPVPINARVLANGKIAIRNLAGEIMPGVILFESRGGRMGFRVLGSLRGEMVVERPALTGQFETLRAALEQILVAEGLYAREAAAMVETWKDSWFEEGTRVFYIVPPGTVDRILPLTISPRPAGVARAFVGRVELITPEIIQTVESAIKHADTKTLDVLGRFLGPISEQIMARTSQDNTELLRLLDSAYKSYVSRLTGCNN